jgi:Ca-activated chloride channel family protein
MAADSSTQPQVVITPARSAVPAAGGHLDVLIRVQAPDAPAAAEPRPPLRLSLVVDRSGSMDGQPLHEALKCASYIAGRLTPDDQVAVVVYDDQIDVVAELQAAGDGEKFRRLLSNIGSGGSTALYDGWLAGAQQLRSGPANALSRVILLSDGQANAGLTEPEAIALQVRDAFDHGVTTTTVGLGRNFNEDLMIRMARAGGGQQYYGQLAADLVDSFDSELQLLEALYARQVRVKIAAAPGVIVEPLSTHPAHADGSLSLSDLAYGAETWLLVRLHLGACGDPQRALLAVTAWASRVDGTPVEVVGPAFELPVVDNAAFEALPADDLVARRLAEVRMAQAAERVRAELARGRVDAARAVLRELDALVAGQPWLQAKLEDLRALIERDAEMAQKELAYSARVFETRLVAKHEASFSLDETDRTDIPAFLRKKTSEGRGRRQ